MTRSSWDRLPAAVRTAIERETGPVLDVQVPNAGRNSDFSATLRLRSEWVFCKGIAQAEGPRGRMHRHERDINPHVPLTVAPRLRWSTEAEGWLVLGFDHVPGRHVDLAPGSPHLPLIATTVNTVARELAATPAQAPRLAQQWERLSAWRRLAYDLPVDLDESARERLAELVRWERRAIELVDGDSLVHTDLHALNILVGAGRAMIVDWAWSRRGNGAVDVAFLINRLIAAGHSPTEAQEWADTVSVWSATPAETRTAFAVAIWGIWEHVQRERGLPGGVSLTTAARRWALHRLEHTSSTTPPDHTA